MKKYIAINWWNHSKPKETIEEKHTELLSEHAMEVVHKLIPEGFAEGHMNQTLMNDKNIPVDYCGHWIIKNVK
jgi:hypothetical protein